MATGPAEGPRGRACYGGVGMLAIAKNTPHPQESWTVLETLVSPELLISWIGCLGFMSVAPSVNYYPDDEVLTEAQDTLQYTFFWPYRSWVFKFWDIESTAIESFLLGHRTVEEAVRRYSCSNQRPAPRGRGSLTVGSAVGLLVDRFTNNPTT